MIPVWLPPLRERGRDVLLLAETFLAAIAQRTLPATRAEDPPQALAELLFMDDPLRRALQDGGRIGDLRTAAREQGFVELAARARGLGSIDAALLADLDRHRYLGEAA